ncbi:MAG: NAD(P)/FAD-dependent oxidoreductase [Bacteroidetes bacterium]|nr:NAD(P)/FAD-dependent oxidoreductase [Bacteroidota bacterium]MCH8940930.1 NAD(P)/FAD-dependent oxidoreductase [Bacteroidota bacterium]
MKEEYDIIVVGAGPAGTIAAQYAAKEGSSVLVLEKDRDVGYPVRCAEAINREGLEAFIKPDPKWINAEITKFGFVAPNGKKVIIDLGKVEGYMLERRIFDYELAKIASEAGAEILTRTYVNGLILEDGKVTGVKYEFRGQQMEVRAKIVIGADGVESRVGKWAGLETCVDFRDMECCFQVTAANVQCDQDTLFFYFGKEVAPEGYFWVFPKGEGTANIGLGVSGGIGKKRSALSYLNSNLEKFFPTANILTQVAGGVPSVITLEEIAAPGIMLVGDAARQVNPLSGGGISSGMIGGSIAGKLAAQSIKNNNLNYIKKYPKEWHKARGKKHKILDKLKDGIYSFTDEQFNKLIESLIKLPSKKRTIGRFFIIALANKPSLLKEIVKVFVI